MTLRLPRSWARAAALLALAGCTAWRPTDLRGAQAPAPSGRADAVRVTTRDGIVTMIWAVRAVGDSLVGRHGAGRQAARVAVARADVTRLERQAFDWDRSGLLVIAGIAAVPMLGALVYAYSQ